MIDDPLSFIDSFSDIKIEPSLRDGFMLDEIMVFPNKGVVVRNQEHHHDSPKAMEVLFILSCCSGHVLSRKAILGYVWGEECASNSSLSSVITELRHLLDDHTQCPAYIQTLPRRGYRLLVHAQPLNQNTLSTEALRTAAYLDADQKQTRGKSGRIFGGIDYWRKSRMLKVAGTYIVMSWVLMQVITVTIPVIDVAKWLDKVALVILIIGLPLVLAYNWWAEYKLRKYFLRKNNSQISNKEVSIYAYRDLAFISILLVCCVAFSAFLSKQALEAATAEPIKTVANPRIKAQFLNNAVAVMLFKYLGNESSDNLDAVIQSELLAFLSQSVNIKVVSERVLSSLPESTSLQNIRDWTGAKYVLEGVIHQQEDNVKITTSLIDSESGLQVWSANHINSLADKLHLIDGISQQVYNALTFLIPQSEKSIMQFRPTNDIAAYDFYVRAKALLKDAYSEEQLKEVEDLFLKAIKRDSQFALARVGLCQTYLEYYSLVKIVRIFELAKQSCQQSIDNKGSGPDSYFTLGSLYFSSGKYDFAEQSFSKGLQLQPNNSLGLMGLAKTLAKLDKPAEAEQLFIQAINAEPGYWRAYAEYGVYLFSSGKYFDASLQFYKQSVLQPNSEAAFNNLGAAYYLDTEFDKATDSWRKAIKIRPSANVYSNLGTSLFLAKRFDEAIEMYQEAIELNPTDFIVKGNLADAFKYAGNLNNTAKAYYQEALELAKENEQINPNDITIKASIARYRSELGMCEQANSTLSLIEKTGLDDPYTFYDLALVAGNCGTTKQVITFLQKTLSSGYSARLLLSDHQFGRYHKQILEMR